MFWPASHFCLTEHLLFRKRINSSINSNSSTKTNVKIASCYHLETHSRRNIKISLSLFSCYIAKCHQIDN